MLLYLLVYVFFFFKQKTAYEMRISDWSSDVCSSDLVAGLQQPVVEAAIMFDRTQAVGRYAQLHALAERVRQQRHILQVRQEGALGLVVGVADIVANLAALAGQFADARHRLCPRQKNFGSEYGCVPINGRYQTGGSRSEERRVG